MNNMVRILLIFLFAMILIVNEVSSSEPLPILKIADTNSGIADIDNDLRLVYKGEEIIRFSFSDKKVTGIDGRIIGYLNDEEIEILRNFFK